MTNSASFACFLPTPFQKQFLRENKKPPACHSYIRTNVGMTVGALHAVMKTQDIIKIFAGRTNLRDFKTEEEARAWLNS